MINRKHVLLLGSGMMAESVVKKLTKRPENDILIASNIVADAQKIAQKYGNCSSCSVDVQDSNSLGPLVEKSDIVISYIPATLHVWVAKQCLKFKKNLVTASYVSAEMDQLNEQAKKLDLIFLNELGLDPGIDHMSTMKVVNEVKSKGGKILEYESWCGGLPSPQFCDNPLGYKFTWSPIGAMRAVKNNAKYIVGSKEYVLPQEDLLYKTEIVEINPALTMEGYANRDSVSYQKIYQLEGTSKIRRGTLRYKGYCLIISAFKEIGLFDEVPIVKGGWRQEIEHLLAAEPPTEVDQELLDGAADQELLGKIAGRTVYKVKHYQGLTDIQKKEKVEKIIKGMKFFGLLSPATKFQKPTASRLQNLVVELQKKLKLKDGQADLIAMQHVFRIEYPGKKPITLRSSLIMIGEKHGASAMSVTVGYPTAIGAQLVLDGKISLRGVLRPTEKEIYEPALEQLAKEGIKLEEIQE